MRQLADFPLVRTLARLLPARLRGSRRGSVLILVVVVLVLVFLAGTGYLATTRLDRQASRQVADNVQVELLMDGLVAMVEGWLSNSDSGNAHIEDLLLADRTPFDPDHDVAPPPSADPSWLALSWPLVKNGTGGADYAFESPDGTTIPLNLLSTPGQKGNFRFVPSGPAFGNLPTYPHLTVWRWDETDLVWSNNLDAVPGVEGPLPAIDADGDGIADAIPWRLPIGTINGLTFFAGVRVIDHNSAVNATTALSRDQERDGDYVAVEELDEAPSYFTGRIGLQELLRLWSDGTDTDGPDEQILRLNLQRFNLSLADPTPLTPVPIGVTGNDEGEDPLLDDAMTSGAFDYDNVTDALHMGLSRRPDQPGFSADATRFVPFLESDSAALAYRFVLRNPLATPTPLEEILQTTLQDTVDATASPVGEPVRTTPYAANDVATWYDKNFDWDLEVVGTPQTYRTRRALIVPRNPISTAAPTKPNIDIEDTNYDAATGELPPFLTDSAYLATAPGAGMPPYENGSATLAPTASKVDINTASFPELFRAFFNVMAEGVDTTSVDTPFDTINTDIMSGFAAGTADDPYHGNIFTQPVGAGVFAPAQRTAAPIGPMQNPMRMFRSSLRPPPDGAGSFTAATLRFSGSSQLILRAAIAAANAMELRDLDYNITPRQVAVSLDANLPAAQSTLTEVETVVSATEVIHPVGFVPDPAVTDGTWYLRFLAGSANDGEERLVTSYDSGTRQITVGAAFPNPIAALDDFQLIKKTAGSSQVRVTVYGVEPQPYITEIYANAATGYVAVELHNPYPFPMVMANCRLVRVNRANGEGPSYAPYDGHDVISVLDFADAAFTLLTNSNWDFDGVPGLDPGAKEPEVIPANGFLVLENYYVGGGGVGRPAEIVNASSFVAGAGIDRNYAYVPSLGDVITGGVSAQELVLLRPTTAIMSADITGDGLADDVDADGDVDAADVALQFTSGTAPTPAILSMVPLDQYDFTGLTSGATEQWHYVRANDWAAGMAWHFVYPGRYDANPALVAGRTPARHQGTVSSTSGSAVPAPAVAFGTFDAVASYPVTFPIQLSNVNWPGDPNVESAGLPAPLLYPFGGFGRDGDILQVPFVGAYVINVSGELWEANSVTIDSAFAEDAVSPPLAAGTGFSPEDRDRDATFDPTEDVNGNATLDVADAFESVGRFAPMPEEDLDRFVGRADLAGSTTTTIQDTLTTIGSAPYEATLDAWIGAEIRITDNAGTDYVRRVTGYTFAGAVRTITFAPALPGIPDGAPYSMTRPKVYGRATGGTTTTLETTSLAPATAADYWVGAELVVVDAAGTATVRLVTDFVPGASSTITFEPALTAAPDASTVFTLRHRNWYGWATDLFEHLTVETPSGDYHAAMANQGLWSPATPYRFGQIVQLGGDLWTCLVPHQSVAGTLPPDDAVNWSRITWRHPVSDIQWRVSTAYVIGQLVKIGDTWYECTADHTSPDPAPIPSDAYWTMNWTSSSSSSGPRPSVMGYVSANPGPSDVTFDGSDGLAIVDGYFVGKTIMFVSGENTGVKRAISAYTGASQTITVGTPWPEEPDVGDSFVIFGDEENAPLDSGRININTASWKVLATLPLVIHNTGIDVDKVDPTATEELAKAIVYWRDVDADPDPTVIRPHGPFKSIFELTDVIDLRPATALTVTAGYGLNGFRNAMGTVSTAVAGVAEAGDAQGDLSPREIPPVPEVLDTVRGDFEERFLTLNRISNLITVRSDTFSVYLVIQGWRNAGTASAELVAERRKAFIVDRSQTRAGGTLQTTQVATE